MKEIRCSKCCGTYPADDFHKDSSRPTGRKSQCIRCRNKADAERSPAKASSLPKGYNPKPDQFKQVALAGEQIALHEPVCETARQMNYRLVWILTEQLFLVYRDQLEACGIHDTRARDEIRKTIHDIRDRLSQMISHLGTYRRRPLGDFCFLGDSKEAKFRAALVLLDLDPDVDHNWVTIRSAYRKKSAEHHPDKGGNDKAMAEINGAFCVLGEKNGD